mgnify:CR=1 FL=1
MDKPRHEPALTVMGPGTKWDGDLSFEGRVRVDGHFEGRMYTEDVPRGGREGEGGAGGGTRGRGTSMDLLRRLRVKRRRAAAYQCSFWVRTYWV